MLSEKVNLHTYIAYRLFVRDGDICQSRIDANEIVKKPHTMDTLSVMKINESQKIL
jgi:hypothetical protein